MNEMNRNRIDLSSLEQQLDSGDDAQIWDAAILLSEYVSKSPEVIWPTVIKYSSNESENVREAIATCVLEHILEYHFDKYFSKIEDEVRLGNKNLLETLSRCWKFGQAEKRKNSLRWENLLKLSDKRIE